MVTTKSSKKNTSTHTPTLKKGKGASSVTRPSSPLSSSDITTREKLSQLRELMKKHHLSAYWIPSSDEHLNEYLPSERQRREWMSGFTGSMGDMLVTLDEAYLFVDSRYYQQADLEVDLSQITVIKLLMPNQPSMVEVFRKVAELKFAEKKGEAFQLGFDPNTVTLEIYRGLVQALSPKRLKNATLQWCPVSENLVDTLWNVSRSTQKKLPPITHLPDSISGLGTASKIQLIQAWMQKHQVDLLPIIKLDQIAWFLNLRGQDIPYNPLFMAYALVSPQKVYLFTAEARIPDTVKKSLGKSVEILPYDDFFNKLQTLIQKFPTPPCKVLIDPKLMPYGTLLTAEKAGAEIIELDHPTQLMKALKNPVELEGMRLANLKASLAKTRAFLWLQIELKKNTSPKMTKSPKKGKKAAHLPSVSSITEETFRQAIEKFYAQDPAFNGLSFNTISGSGPNSSIVHYGTPDPEKSLLEGELFLIDSGVQYQHGTTDDTRTVIVGKPTQLQKKRYTEVLKAHINCASQQFPKGTEGTRLDGITRSTLWNAGLDYGHGTGHGVGACLNVHEGPNGIHKFAKEPFQPGMITSIEPGYYEPGWGGIRLENLYEVVVKEKLTSSDGTPWYGFESLTYIPFDKKLILKKEMTPAQWQWLKKYHAQIVKKLSPLMSEAESRWLKKYCDLEKS